MTRRELLMGAAGAAALWARSHWDRTRISAITDEIGNSADEAVDFARHNGILFVEVRHEPGTDRDYAGGREAEMAAAAAHLVNGNVKVSMVHTSLLRFGWPGTQPAQGAVDQARWDRRLDDFQQALHCAHVMGADKIALFAGARVADPGGLASRIAETVSEMAPEAEKQKVSLLLQVDPATNLSHGGELAAVLPLIPSKFVGVNWNPAAAGYALLPKKRIFNVRAPAASLAPGKTESLNWKSVLTTLEKDGYNGRVTVETGLTGDAGIALASDSVDQLAHFIREVE